jgi:hypothetical protein
VTLDRPREQVVTISVGHRQQLLRAGNRELIRQHGWCKHWVLEDAQPLGNVGLGAPDGRRHLVRAPPMPPHQYFQGLGLLAAAQILALKILDQRQQVRLAFGSGPHQRWDRLPSQQPRGCKPAMPGDELIVIADLPHEHGLQKTIRLQRRRQLVYPMERAPRVSLANGDFRHGDRPHLHIRLDGRLDRLRGYAHSFRRSFSSSRRAPAAWRAIRHQRTL